MLGCRAGNTNEPNQSLKDHAGRAQRTHARWPI